MSHTFDLTQLQVAPSLNWYEAWGSWLRFEETKRGGGALAKNSLDAYLQSVKNFVDWFENKNSTFNFSDFTVENVNAYFAWLEDERTPVKTWNHRLTSLRKVVKWAIRNAYLNEDPTRMISRKFKIERVPRKIDADQVKALEIVANTTSHLKRGTELWSRLGLRDQVIWHLLCAKLRVSEVNQVQLHDLNLDEGTLRVAGKGGTEGDVTLTSQAVAVMKEWLTLRSTLRFASSHQHLITDWNGKALLDDNQIRRRLKAMAAQAGLDVTPHVMRHTKIHELISTLVQMGWGLQDAVRAAADEARQRDVRTTWNYLRVSQADVRLAIGG